MWYSYCCSEYWCGTAVVVIEYWCGTAVVVEYWCCQLHGGRAEEGWQAVYMPRPT